MTSTKNRIRERQAKNRELGAQDNAARCRHCKTVLDFARRSVGMPFCSDDCEQAHAEFQQRWMAAKSAVEARR